MNKPAAGFLLTGLLLWGEASALGLGEIQLDSALNQPLEAEIDLVRVGQTPIEDIQARLAPRKAFERVGLERPFVLTRLQFETAATQGGQPVIRVTTDRPIREPLLSFLVEVKWPQGRMLREYTVFLDPPSQQPQGLQQAEAPPRSEPTPAPPEAEGARRAAQAPGPSGEGAGARPEEPGPDTYRVEPGDTLWEIAEALRPGPDVSTVQTAIALQRANPEAFARRNINNLRQGAVLTVPSRQDMASMEQREAQQAFREQMAAWRQDRAGRGRQQAAREQPQQGDTEAGTEPGAGTEGEGEAGAKPEGEQARVELLGAEPEATEGELEALRRRAALAEEKAASLERENQALQAQVRELESLLAKKQRLLSLKSQQLATLEEQRGAGGSSVQERDGSNGQAAQTGSPQGTGWLAWIAERPVWLLSAGVLAILIVLLLMFYLRRRGTEERGADIGLATGAAGAASPGERSYASSTGTGYLATPAPAAEPPPTAGAEEAAPTPPMEPAAEGRVEAPEEAGDDVLAEADVYLAYGLYQQAEEVLKKAVAEQPARGDYRLKLLETYRMAEDRKGFETAAEDWYEATGGEPADAWQEAVAMGRELAPEHRLFRQDAEEPPAVEVAAVADEAQGPEPAGPSVGERAATGQTDEGQATEDWSLDFDIGDLDFGSEAERPSGTATAEQREEAGAEEEPYRLEPGALSLEETPPAAHEGGAQPEPSETEAGAEASTEEAERRSELEAEDFDLDQAVDALSEGSEAGGAGTAETQAEGAETEARASEPQGGDEEAPSLYLDESLEFDMDELYREGESGSRVEEAPSGEEAPETSAGEEWDLGSYQDAAEEVNTKLDLAHAYIDMGDREGARGMLEEVQQQGNDEQRQQAAELLERLERSA